MAALQPPPPTPMAPTLVPVVGPQFCLPSIVVLDISVGDYSISGVNNGIWMKVEGRSDSRSTHVLYDAAGLPIITMRRKLLSMHDRWNIYRGDSDDQKDLLFTVITHNFTLKTELDVFLATNPTEQQCDFKVKQKGHFHRSYEFFLGASNTVIALMSREHGLNTHLKVFRATVYPYIDYAFVIAITVILQIENESAREGIAEGVGEVVGQVAASFIG